LSAVSKYLLTYLPVVGDCGDKVNSANYYMLIGGDAIEAWRRELASSDFGRCLCHEQQPKSEEARIY